MSTLTYAPDYSAQKQVKPQVRSVKFGDGYEQRLTFGMNQQPSKWSLTFNLRDLTEANGIEAFFSTLKGTDSFDWTPPDAVASKKFLARSWSKTIEKGNWYSITVEIEETFDP